MADYFLPRKKWHDKEWTKKKKNWYSYIWSWENFSTPQHILLENYGHVHFQTFYSITLGEQRDLTLYFLRKKTPVIPWLRTRAFHASQHIKTRRKSFIGLALTRRKEVEIYERKKKRPCLSKVDRISVPTPFLYAFPQITTR